MVDEYKVGSNWKTYVDAFVFGCKIRNLAPRTLVTVRSRHLPLGIVGCDIL
jgi:hypothetical protein